jgi:hypothetical protein
VASLLGSVGNNLTPEEYCLSSGKNKLSPELLISLSLKKKKKKGTFNFKKNLVLNSLFTHVI